MTTCESPTSGTLRAIPTDGIAATYDERDLGALSDRELIAEAVAVIAEPRHEPADSFVLHAPLELIARARLLAVTPTELQRLARLRIVSIAARYQTYRPAEFEPEATGAAAPENGAEPTDGADPEEVVDRLGAAIAHRTAAAAHGPIFLAGLSEVPDAAVGWLPMLRPLARELARHPDWGLGWIDRRAGIEPDADPAAADPATEPDPAADPDVAAAALFDVLADPPRLGVPGSTFIHPLMMQVDQPGVAARLLGPVVTGLATTAATARAVTRVAALAMVRDATDHAPYGWTHCLTLPQAIVTLAPRLETAGVPALAIAATQILGFRAALGTVTLDPDDPLIRAADPSTEAARRARLVAETARRHDAHIAKYLLAVLNEARRDPGASHLYLTAGEHLLDVWDANGPDPDDVLADHVPSDRDHGSRQPTAR